MRRLLDIAGATLASFLPKPNKQEIDSYGHNNVNLPPEEVQKVIEWLMLSLANAGYTSKAHLIWDAGDQGLNKTTLTVVLRNEPVFLYRCGDRPSDPPEKCYWRLMGEHPSLRIYQLEVQADE